MSELKPCPYCGGEATIKHLDWFIPGQFLYGAKCSGCGAESAVKSIEDEAVEAWNARAEYDKLVNFIQENLWHRAAMTMGAEVREQLADELYELGCEVEA